MEFVQESGAIGKISADIVIVGIFQDEKIKETLAKLDPAIPESFAATITQECGRENFTGKSKQSIQFATFNQMSAARLILCGLGKKSDFDTMVARRAIASAARRLASAAKLEAVAVELRIENKPEWVQAIVEGWLLGTYQFHKYKTKAEDKKQTKVERLLICACLPQEQFTEAINTGQAISEATNFARDMIAEPPAVMTPSRLAEIASGIAGGAVSCEILDEKQAADQGMGAFLGVARGAAEPPRFIILRYSHPQAKKTIALAGKGITFDSGGLSIKTAQGMENMKYDMSGAAAVIATMQAIGKLKPAVNVVAVAAATENMPGSTALHPGDILTAMNGKTIEVNNTDAEGRLVLADALSYLTKQKPDEIIDVATLTGAVVTALGRAAAGIMGNNEPLIKRIIASGYQAGERFWHLPLFDEYKEALKSDVADLKNAGARGEAPSSAGGMFLKEFVDGKPWVHLDIAGPAWIDKEKDDFNKGGTAFSVRTLCYYILSQAE
jgi:leucyl aminopeptidase